MTHKVLKSGDRIFITDQRHPWVGQAGTILHHEEYGPGGGLKWTGWRAALDNGFETYVNSEQVMGPGRVDSIRMSGRRRAR